MRYYLKGKGVKIKTEIEQILGSYGIHDTENKLITNDLILALKSHIQEAYNSGYCRGTGRLADQKDMDSYSEKKMLIVKEELREVESSCLCGEKVIVSYSPKFSGRADGKRVCYPDDRMDKEGKKGCIFRCRKCGNVIADTCNEARYERFETNAL